MKQPYISLIEGSTMDSLLCPTCNRWCDRRVSSQSAQDTDSDSDDDTPRGAVARGRGRVSIGATSTPTKSRAPDYLDDNEPGPSSSQGQPMSQSSDTPAVPMSQGSDTTALPMSQGSDTPALPMSQGSDNQPSQGSQGSGSSQATSVSSGTEGQLEDVFNSSFDAEEEREDNEEELKIAVPIPQSISGGNSCIVCPRHVNLKRVSSHLKFLIYLEKGIFCPDNARACGEHFVARDSFTEETLNSICLSSTWSTMTVEQFKWLTNQTRAKAKATLFDRFKDPKKFDMTDFECIRWTGFNKEELLRILGELVSMRDREERSKLQALAAYLIRLRYGIPLTLLSTIFGFDDYSKTKNHCKSVESAFAKDYVPKHLGVHSHSRLQLIENETTQMSQALFDPSRTKLILVADASYSYIQKSSYNTFQKQSYSLHKNKNLAKPFVITTTNGLIVSVTGPHLPNESDGKILEKLLKENQPLKAILREGDIFILDRGFTRSQAEIEKMGYKVYLPASPTAGSGKRLTTLQANDSRMVTKIRWVIETVHGILKNKYRLLDLKRQNKSLCKITIDFLVASCLNNVFGARLISDKDDWQEISNLMIQNRLRPNILQTNVLAQNLNQRSSLFVNIEDVADSLFPDLNDRQIKLITLGNYHIKQGIKYLIDHFTNGDKEFQAYKQPQGNRYLLRAKIDSRHRGQTKYFVYVEYTRTAITGHFCNCPNGARTVGCCSHIASLIIFFGKKDYDRTKAEEYAIKLSKFFLAPAKKNIPHVVHESEDEFDDDE